MIWQDAGEPGAPLFCYDGKKTADVAGTKFFFPAYSVRSFFADAAGKLLSHSHLLYDLFLGGRECRGCRPNNLDFTLM